MNGQTPVPDTDPILDAPYGDAGLRLGLLDAATLVRAKQEQKRLLRSGTAVSLRQLLLQSGVIGPDECRRIEGKLKIRVVDEPDGDVSPEPADRDRVPTDVLIEPVPPPEVVSDSDGTGEDHGQPEAEPTTPVSAETVPPPPESEATPAAFTAADEIPEVLECEDVETDVAATSSQYSAPPDVAGYLDAVSAQAGGEAAAQEAVALVFEEAANGENEHTKPTAASVDAMPGGLADQAPEPETPEVHEPVEVTGPAPAPAAPALPSPVPQPTLTPAMIAAAANAPSTASKRVEHPDGHRPWYRRPSRLLAAGLLAFFLVLLLGTAYSPETGFFRSFLPQSGNANAVTSLFGWWNRFASETIGGELFREETPVKRRR